MYLIMTNKEFNKIQLVFMLIIVITMFPVFSNRGFAILRNHLI